jgi:succinate dehydrogenase / fumarate reductase, membrane anchor subunit
MSIKPHTVSVTGLGSAKNGFYNWWFQRISAIAIVFLGLWLLISFVGISDLSYGQMMDWFQEPIHAFLLILTILSVGIHSKLGIEVIIEDYVHSKATKVISLILNVLLHISLTALGVFSIVVLFIGV